MNIVNMLWALVTVCGMGCAVTGIVWVGLADNDEDTGTVQRWFIRIAVVGAVALIIAAGLS